MVPWDRVPGRTEKWKEKVLGDLNHDYAKFSQEYECVEYSTRVIIKDDERIFNMEIGELAGVDVTKNIDEVFNIPGVVYCITRTDGLKYIGITKDLKRRLFVHRKSNRFSSGILDVEILYEGQYLECMRLEGEFISKYDTHKNGLNKTSSGGLLQNGHYTNLGQPHSEEVRERMRSAKKKQTYRPPKGTKHSEETRKAISDARKGKSNYHKTSTEMQIDLKKEFDSYKITISDIESIVCKKHRGTCHYTQLSQLRDAGGCVLNEKLVKQKVLYRKYAHIMSRTHYRNIVS
jgi:hypothetical protein